MKTIGLIGSFLSSALAAALPLISTFEGSTDEEELFSITASFPTTSLISELPTTPAGPQVNADALKRVEDFLRKNTLLILVTITLVFLIFLIICGAFFMSRKQKVNAYYPSSFPSKIHKQLQADIVRAARSLRTPSKTVIGGQKDHNSEEMLKPQESSILVALLPSLPEEEPCQLSVSETAVYMRVTMGICFCHNLQECQKKALSAVKW
uniref:Transmembrane protein 119 n=1 Tax=Neogobius melanostomus TaxID=47308 RepID=A0A8C6WP00_9GOBI